MLLLYLAPPPTPCGLFVFSIFYLISEKTRNIDFFQQPFPTVALSVIAINAMFSMRFLVCIIKQIPVMQQVSCEIKHDRKKASISGAKHLFERAIGLQSCYRKMKNS